MFKGVISALITPFNNGQVDVDALKRLINYQIEGGIDGIVPCGTTGESATLTHDEHKKVIETCVRHVDGRVPVIAGTGSNSTNESVSLTRFAKECGADGALLITPYYNKPTQEGLIRHYETVADAVDIPIVLYNVPGRTAVDMLPETIANLSHRENIVSVKEATADMERASVIRHLCGDRMGLISGDDATFLPFLSVGGEGVISVSANIAPERMTKLYKYWKKGETEKARKVHDQLLGLNRMLFFETSPIPIKGAAALMGLCSNEVRLPLVPVSKGLEEALHDMLKRLGIPMVK